MEPKPYLNNILIIDDDEEYNFLTEEAMREAGVTCRRTYLTRGHEALEHLTDPAGAFPDLILLDINMPVMNGWEFLEEYEQRKFHRKPAQIIMISSSVFDEDRKKALAYRNVIDYVGKPLTGETLTHILNTYFKKVMQV